MASHSWHAPSARGAARSTTISAPAAPHIRAPLRGPRAVGPTGPKLTRGPVTTRSDQVFGFATHGLFSGSAAERIEGSSLEEVVVANTIPLSPQVQKDTRKVCRHRRAPQERDHRVWAETPIGCDTPHLSRGHQLAERDGHTGPLLINTCMRGRPSLILACVDAPQVRLLSVGKLLAQAIHCIHTGDSVSRLFDPSQGAALLA